MSLTPGSVSVDVRGEHLILTVTLARTAFHSGRPLYLVACETCRVLLHEETTGPKHWVDIHVREATHSAECATPRERMTER